MKYLLCMVYGSWWYNDLLHVFFFFFLNQHHWHPLHPHLPGHGIHRQAEVVKEPPSRRAQMRKKEAADGVSWAIFCWWRKIRTSLLVCFFGGLFLQCTCKGMSETMVKKMLGTMGKYPIANGRKIFLLYIYIYICMVQLDFFWENIQWFQCLIIMFSLKWLKS